MSESVNDPTPKSDTSEKLPDRVNAPVDAAEQSPGDQPNPAQAVETNADATTAMDSVQPEKPEDGALSADERIAKLQERISDIQRKNYFAWRRRHLRTAILLFLLTLLSTFIVGAGYFPLHYLIGILSPRYAMFLEYTTKPEGPHELLRQSAISGLWYAVPLMLILLAHEMGHFVVSLWNRVPGTLPYFIPMPLPPLGTMGAVIFQDRADITRRQMFDVAIWGPIAGLIVTLPVLWLGLRWSEYLPRTSGGLMEFGDPLILQWMSQFVHGPVPSKEHVLVLHPLGFAGWVGIFVTSLNLLPVGQLDGGHILYTLIGRKAHIVALLVMAAAVGWMIHQQSYSFTLMLLLLLATGPFHPPTNDDKQPLGWRRHVFGWLTMSFLIIGFTPTPIAITGDDDAEVALECGGLTTPSIAQRCDFISRQSRIGDLARA